MEAQLQHADAVLAAGHGAAAEGREKLKRVCAAHYLEDDHGFSMRDNSEVLLK